MLTIRQRKRLAKLKLNDFLSACDLRETQSLKYVDGYKYQSRNDVFVFVGVEIPQNVVTDLVVYRKDGWMQIKKYFAWDGASGPTIDTPCTIIGSEVHDAGYYLIAEGLLPPYFRAVFDELLGRLMVRDRCPIDEKNLITKIKTSFLSWCGKVRAKYYHWAVDKFAEKYATKKGRRKVKVAP